MSRQPRQIASTLAAAAVAACLAPAAGEAATATLTPLPASEYATSPACSAPRPGHAGCMAVRLAPKTAAARGHTHPIGVPSASPGHGSPAAEGKLGLRPSDLHSAYELPDTSEGTQTIALVDAYNDPTAAADLQAYEREFGISSCTGGECFKQVGQNGLPGEANLPFPKTTLALEKALTSGTEEEQEEAEEAIGWGVEISLDIETARAICQNCHILLVEADSSGYSDLEAAEESAYSLHATEISNSWGGSEAPSTAPFDHPGTVITASTGDDGYLGWDARYADERGFANFPASSPYVVAVGGTHLRLGAGSSWGEETVWNGEGAGGSGCSTVFSAPAWQESVGDWASVGCGRKRAEADVSADADPYTGVAITDSDDPGELCEETIEGSPLPDWCTYGGTSLASPLVASVFALAGGAHGVSYPAQTLYESLRHAPGTLHDVVKGSNGECKLGVNSEGVSRCEPAAEASKSCSSKLICLAHAGYDGPSGVGTPHGLGGFQPGAEEAGAEEPGLEPALGSNHKEETPASNSTTTSPTSTNGSQAPPASSPPASTVVPVAVEVSGLSLTSASRAVIAGRHPTAARIVCSFALNMAARLRVTLARRVRSGRRWRWATVGTPAMFTAPEGRDSRRLAGGRKLAKGVYRLTLAPVGGRPRSIDFDVA